MFRKYRTVLLSVTVVFLAGCSSADYSLKDYLANNNNNQEEAVASEEVNVEREKSVLSNTEENTSKTANETNTRENKENIDELQQKMQEKVRKIHSFMTNEQEHNDWFMLKEDSPSAFSSELKRIKRSLSDWIADDFLDEEARTLLEAYTCYCDSYFLFTEKDTYAGFTINEQTEDSFTASTITLDDGFYGNGWKNQWQFEKEAGNWKLSGYDYIFADDRPLDVTFEQIEDSFFTETGKREAVTFIEYLNIKDVRHMVIQRENDEYEIYNTETGALNYTAMEQYSDNE